MKQLKAIRKLQGLSAKALGDAVHVSAMSIYRYESGKRQPDVETAYKIATVLKVSISDLLGTKKAG